MRLEERVAKLENKIKWMEPELRPHGANIQDLIERVASLEKYRVDYMQVCERLAGLEEGTRQLDNDQDMLADAMCLKAERERVLEMEERVVLLEEAGSDQHVAIAELEERVAILEEMGGTWYGLGQRVARLEHIKAEQQLAIQRLEELE